MFIISLIESFELIIYKNHLIRLETGLFIHFHLKKIVAKGENISKIVTSSRRAVM